MKMIFRFIAIISAALAFQLADWLEFSARWDADQSELYWRRWGRHVHAAVSGNALTGHAANAAHRLGRYYYKRVVWGDDEVQMLQLCRDAISRLAKAPAVPSAKPLAFLPHAALAQITGGAK